MAVGAADALLSHESALALLDLSDNIPDGVHLLVPRRHRGLRRPPGVIVHTRPDGEEVATVWRDGLPLTAPARTLLDVADRLQPEQLSMAVRQALRRGLLTREQLQEEAEPATKHTIEAILTSRDAPMKYTSAAAFRQALEERLKNEAASTGLGLARLRKRVAFELFLRRLLVVAPDRWVLKGALALNFRLAIATRSTKDIDLGRDDDEQAAIADITAAQQLMLDDYFTFAATRTDELEDTDEFSAVRFHVTAQLAGRTFEQFLVDIGFSDRISWTPDTIHTSESLSFAGIDATRAPRDPDPTAPRREGTRLHPHLWTTPTGPAPGQRTSSTSS